MKALALPAFDHHVELIDLPLPAVEEGQIRVKVHAASVNGFDLAVSAGYLRGRMEHHFPVVIGKDFAGIVAAVGDNVTGFRAGDRVFGVVSESVLGTGSFGEYVTVAADFGVTLLPDEISFDDGAALGLAGTTARDALNAATMDESTTVLISGATGGVGQQLLQLAAATGAHMIATAPTPTDVDLLTTLGASQTVDSSRNITEQMGKLHPDGVDVVFHLAGDVDALSALVKSTGTFVTTIALDLPPVLATGARAERIMAMATRTTLDDVAAAHASGLTTLSIAAVYTLDEFQSALARFTSGKRGKIVVRPNLEA